MSNNITEFNQLFDKFKFKQSELLDQLKLDLQIVIKVHESSLSRSDSGTKRRDDQEDTILLAIRNLLKQEQEGTKPSHQTVSPPSSSANVEFSSSIFSPRVDIIKQETQVVEIKNEKTGTVEFHVKPVPNGYSFEEIRLMEYEANPNSRFPLPVNFETSASSSNWYKPAGMTIHPFSGSNSLFASDSNPSSTTVSTSSQAPKVAPTGFFGFGAYGIDQPTSSNFSLPTHPVVIPPSKPPLFGTSGLTPSLFGKPPVITSSTQGFSKFNTLPNSFGGILSQPNPNLFGSSNKVIFGLSLNEFQKSREGAKVTQSSVTVPNPFKLSNDLEQKMVEVDRALADLSVLQSERDKLITDVKKYATPELSSTFRLPNSANSNYPFSGSTATTTSGLFGLPNGGLSHQVFSQANPHPQQAFLFETSTTSTSTAEAPTSATTYETTTATIKIGNTPTPTSPPTISKTSEKSKIDMVIEGARLFNSIQDEKVREIEFRKWERIVKSELNPSSLDIFATAEEKDPFKDSSGSFRSQTTESSDEDSINSEEVIIRTQAGVFGIVDGKEKEAVLKVAEEKKKRVENNEKVGKDSDTWTLLSSSSGSKGKASPEKTKERE